MRIVLCLVNKKDKFKCVVCGKISAGRLPRGGDGSLWYPRRHKVNGKDCAGNIIKAETISTRNTLNNK